MAKRYEAKKMDKIRLGRRGENLARKIVFDVSGWQSEYGAGTIELLHHHESNAAPYPVKIKQEEGVVIWPVTKADTAASGSGKCELRMIVDDVVVKSHIYNTVVLPSLTDEIGDAPPPGVEWVEAVLEAARNAMKPVEIGENGNWYVDGVDTGFSAIGKDGKPGEKGEKGDPGTPGKDGADGKTPEKGVDYYTEEDKAEFVDAVLAALPNGDEVYY